MNLPVITQLSNISEMLQGPGATAIAGICLFATFLGWAFGEGNAAKLCKVGFAVSCILSIPTIVGLLH